MAPNIEIQPPHFVFYPVDECEKVTVQRAVAVVGHVFQLAFAAVCDELISSARNVGTLYWMCCQLSKPEGAFLPDDG